MKKQETVLEALKNIFHHIKKWADPDLALKRGVLLPVAIVFLCFPNILFFQKNDFKRGLVAIILLITVLIDLFDYQYLLKKCINNGKFTTQIEHCSLVISGLRGMVFLIAVIELIQSLVKIKQNLWLIALLSIVAIALGVVFQKIFIRHCFKFK